MKKLVLFIFVIVTVFLNLQTAQKESLNDLNFQATTIIQNVNPPLPKLHSAHSIPLNSTPHKMRKNKKTSLAKIGYASFGAILIAVNLAALYSDLKAKPRTAQTEIPISAITMHSSLLACLALTS